MKKYIEKNWLSILIMSYLVFLILISLPSNLMILRNFFSVDLGQYNLFPGLGPKKIMSFGILTVLFFLFSLFVLFISQGINNLKKLPVFLVVLSIGYGSIVSIFYPNYFLTKEHLKAQALIDKKNENIVEIDSRLSSCYSELSSCQGENAGILTQLSATRNQLDQVNGQLSATVREFTIFRNQLTISSPRAGLGIGPERWTEAVRHQNSMGLNRLKMVDMSDFDFEDVFFNLQVQKENIRSFSEMYQFVIQRYENYRDYLQKSWSIDDEEKLFSFFAMNFVSSLWGYGSPSGKGGAGCVMVNELTDFETIPPEDVTVRTYLDSPIGCCTDYTTILKFILDMRGIKNRVMLISGHVFNEVFLEGRWWCLDANIGIAFGESWEKISSDVTLKSIPTFLFPHSNMFSHDHRFRKSIGTFRTYMLTVAGNGSLKPIQYFPENKWYSEAIEYGSVFKEAVQSKLH